MKTIPMIAPISAIESKYEYEAKNFIDKVALIDADVFKYLVAHSMYKKIMDQGLMHSRSMLNEVIDFFISRDVFHKYHAKAYVFCFSAPSSKVFRNHIAQEKEYKGNRKDKTDSTYYPDKYDDMAYVFEYINHRYQTLFFDDLEADDILSFVQQPEKTFIVSIDKDLKQVPGYHFDLKLGIMTHTSEEEGLKLLITQCLTGDNTDGIPGLKGCGPKRIKKITEGENITGYALLIKAINEFISKHGELHGIDMFVEMWGLVSMKINRGEYFRERYGSAIRIVNELIKE